MAKRPRTAKRGAGPLRYRAGNVGERGGLCDRAVVVTVRGPWWASLKDHAACAAQGRAARGFSHRWTTPRSGTRVGLDACTIPG